MNRKFSLNNFFSKFKVNTSKKAAPGPIESAQPFADDPSSNKAQEDSLEEIGVDPDFKDDEAD